MSIWNWDLWHKFKTKTTLVKLKPDFIQKMNEKTKNKTEETSEKKIDNDDEKNKTI